MTTRRFELLLAAMLLAVTTMFCTLFSPPNQPGAPTNDLPATQAALQASQTALAQYPTATETPLPTSTTLPTATSFPTSTPPPAPGSISGSIGYPSEAIPAQHIVAFNLESGETFFTDSNDGQTVYTIPDVPAGTYHVVAYLSSAPDFAGGYTQMVPCGLSVGCTDHSLIDVQVQPGQATSGVDPLDWYAEPGTFPAYPTILP